MLQKVTIVRTGPEAEAFDWAKEFEEGIARLEREIGFVLFKRSKGRLEPTPEAYAFHEVASQALEGLPVKKQTFSAQSPAA